ncbi:MAG: hypothetical protein Q7S16_03010 [bacterium]|nr:hypothetical protein [bacterium]
MKRNGGEAEKVTLAVGDVRICFDKRRKKAHEKWRAPSVCFDSEQPTWMPTHHYNAVNIVANGILFPPSVQQASDAPSSTPTVGQRVLFDAGNVAPAEKKVSPKRPSRQRSLRKGKIVIPGQGMLFPMHE